MVPLKLARWTLDVHTPEGLRNVLDDVSLSVPAATTVALVGESGSGKSTVALGALGLLDVPPFVHRGGAVWLGGHDLLPLTEARRAPLRPGRAAMVFQDPGAALNPTQRVGAQLDEVTRLQQSLGRRAAHAASLQALREVGLDDAERVAACYPHVLSGGMRQRAMVAMALLGAPALLVADEPTTALDVTVQAQLLALLRHQVRARKMACLLVTHDLGVVAGVADQVAVLYAGRVVEEATVAALFAQPRHPYTAALLAAARDLSVPALGGAPPALPGVDAQGRGRPSRCDFAPRCPRADGRCRSQTPPLAPADTATPDVRQVRCHYPLHDGEDWATLCRGLAEPNTAIRAAAVASAATKRPAHAALRIVDVDVRYGPTPALRWLPWSRPPAPPTVQGVSLDVADGEIVALVGESGSGKSTLARAILQLLPLAHGEVWLQQHSLTALWRGGGWTGERRPGRGLRPLRPLLQAVFQDPRASLDPRHNARTAVEEPLLLHRPELGAAERRAHALALLAEVGLSSSLADRRPGALSGGQRQRLALARALAPQPRVLLADEPTSALDVGVKGQVLQLLRQVTRTRGLATLIISHDLAAVRALADRTAVMVAGTVVELGPTAAVMNAPRHPYTQALLAAEPIADPAVQPERLANLRPTNVTETDAGSTSATMGCRYRRRCLHAVPTCVHTPPALREGALGHFVACHVVS